MPKTDRRGVPARPGRPSGAWFFCAGVLLAMTAAGGPAAAAPEAEGAAEGPDGPAPPDEPRVSNVFFDTDLRQALQDIGAAAGVNIIADPSVGGLVTAELDETPLSRAIELVLAGTGFEVTRTKDYWLVYDADPSSPAFRSVSETTYVRLRYGDANAAHKLLPRLLREYAEVDAKSNTICIRAPESITAEIVDAVREFDQPGGHVLLDCRIVVMEHGDVLNLGIEWDFPTIQAGTFSNDSRHGGGGGPDWPWGIEIGYTPSREFTNSLLLALNLLGQNDEATIMATPQVMAQDGKAAEIRVAREEYFTISSGGIYDRVDLEQIDTGTVLTMLPRLSGEGEITLEVTAEVSDVVARGADGLPVVTRRQATSTVRVEDGGTVAIAGLMDARSRRSDQRVPGAARLPLVGHLFTSTVKDDVTRQIAVFVTARIVPDDPADVSAQQARLTLELVTEDEFKPQLIESLQRLRK
ncbi:MAG: type II secretion system protein GspD [Planctomycetota bacterium]